jgi:hypothetical protein
MHGIDHVFGQFGEFVVKDGYVHSGLPEDGFVVLGYAKGHFLNAFALCCAPGLSKGQFA